MPFQVLTGQYSQIITKKFRVAYNDLSLLAPGFGGVQLFTVPRTVEIIGIKVWLRTTFAGTNMTLCVLHCMSGIDFSMANIDNKSYLNFDLLQPSFDYSGRIIMAKDRPNDLVSPTGNYISNQNAPNDFWFVVERNPGEPNPQLTAGEVDIWVMTMKLP